jgi:hypothetical protein
MAKKKRATKKKVKKEEVCEVFDIEKDGKKESKEFCGEQEVEEVKKGQVEKENKLLKNIIIIAAAVILIFLITYFFAQSINEFDFRGTGYNIIDTKNIRFYHTSFPLYLETGKMNYNVYLRTDPRKTEEKIPFDGRVLFDTEMVINSEAEFNCEGKGVIAMANFNQIFTALGMNVMTDPNATCDEEGRYIHITLKESEESSIVQYGSKCYEFNINNCEILDVTERFIIEAVDKIQKY